MINLVICKCGHSFINKPYEELLNKILSVGNQIELEELQRELKLTQTTKGKDRK